MKDTVAIVGSHPGTRLEFDFTRDDCDIWVFNEALDTDWATHADGVFQMHKPVIWRSKTNRNDPKHYEWLKTQTDSIIYMTDKHDDVPMSEAFPLSEVMEYVPTAEKYFTSSVAYAIALGIYKQYKRIELYGVEMETGTEYGHQRTGVAYWVGIAVGLGIEVDFHSNKFFKAYLYGYDGDVQIPISHYEERIEILKPHIKGTAEMFNKVSKMVDDLLNEFIKTYKADLSSLDEKIWAMGKNTHDFGMLDGALQTNQSYLDKSKKMLEESGTYLIVRQEYESYQVAGMKQRRKENINVYNLANVLHKHRDDLMTNDCREVREKLVKQVKTSIQKYCKASTEFGRCDGIMNENIMLTAEFDKYLIAAGISPGDNKPGAFMSVEKAAAR